MEPKFNIQILKVNSPGHFWAKEVPSQHMSPEARQFQQLSQKMSAHFNDDSSQVVRLTSASRGQICIGRRPADKQWYRMKVLDVMATRSCPKASCLLLDFAEKEMIPLQWLREAPPTFLTVPFQAKEYMLHGIQPVTMAVSLEDFSNKLQPCTQWDVAALEFFTCINQASTNRQATIVKQDGIGHYHVKLYMDTPDGSTCINDLLVEKKYADYTHNSAESESVTVRDNISVCSPVVPPSESSSRLAGSSTQSSKDRTLVNPLHVSSTSPPGHMEAKRAVTSPRISPGHKQGKQASMPSTSPHGRMEAKPASPLQVTTTSPVHAGHPVNTSVNSETTGTPGRFQHAGYGRATNLVRHLSPPVVGLARQTVGQTCRQSVVASPDVTNANNNVTTGSASLVTTPSDATNTLSAGRGRGWFIQSLSPNSSSASDSAGCGRGLLLRQLCETAPLSPSHQQLDGDSAIEAISPSPVNTEPQVISDSDSSVRSSNDTPKIHGTKLRARLPRHVVARTTETSSDVETTSPQTTKVRFSDCEQPFRGKTSPNTEMPLKPVIKKVHNSDTVAISDKRSFMGITSPARVLDPISLTAADCEILVYGQMPRPVLQLEDIPFAEQVRRTLFDLGLKRPRDLQAYAWAAIWRGVDVVAVAPHGGGKMYSYIPPLLSCLLQRSNYDSLPEGCGPLAIVMCSSWKRATDVYDTCQLFVPKLHNMRTLLLFGGGSEEHMEVPLINGCELLVCTPHSLLRMLQKKATTLDRLCHLVLHDGDTLTEDFTQQVQNVMSTFSAALTARGDLPVPRQLLLFASQWRDGIEAFVRCFAPSATIIIKSPAEAAIYGGVRQMAQLCKQDQLVSKLVSLVQSGASQLGKMVVFTRTVADATKIFQLLTSQSYYTLLAHHEMSTSQLDTVQREWSLQHQPDSLPILVLTDDALSDLRVHDAGCVVHYALPRSTAEFGRRLWCMMNNFSHPLSEQKKVVKTEHRCLSYLLATENCVAQAAHVVRALKRVGSKVPPSLQALADQDVGNRKGSKEQALCHYLKAFGHCRNQTKCDSRHTLYDWLDDPCVQQRCEQVPVDGKVKILVTHVIDANFYNARLLEHVDRTGVVTPLSSSYIRLTFDLNLWFSQPVNRLPPVHLLEKSMYAFEDTMHTYHRVEVTHLSASGRGGAPEEAEVRFVDTGGYETVATSQLFQLPNPLRDVPFQAVEVFCCRIQPVDNDLEWTDKANMFVSSLIKGKELEGKIILSLASTLWLDPIVERTHLTAINVTLTQTGVRSHLLEKGMAVENPQHVHQLIKACENRLELPEMCTAELNSRKAYTAQGLLTEPTTCTFSDSSHYTEVYLSAVAHPDLMYLQLVQNQDKRDYLSMEIESYRKLTDSASLTEVCQGLLVLAKFPVDEKWYRGKVVAIEGDVYDVFFVDTGEQEMLPLSDLACLPTKLQQLAFQAIECSLMHLEPTGDEWPDSVGDFLWDATRSDDDTPKRLIAEVKQKTAAHMSGEFRYGVTLYDTTREYDLDLRQMLVSSELARASSTFIQEICVVDEDEKVNGLHEITSFFAELLKARDAESRARLSVQIEQIVSSNWRRQNEMQKVGVIRCICSTMAHIWQPAVLCTLTRCLIIIIKDHDGNCEQLQKHGALNTICMILDKVQDLSVQEVLSDLIISIASNQTCKVNLVAYGILRILGDCMQKTKLAKLLEKLCYAARSLLTDLPGRQVSSNSAGHIVKAVCDTLSTNDNNDVLQKCLSVIHTMATLSHLRDSVRKYHGITAICDRLERDDNNMPLRQKCIEVLKSLATDNRFNRDAMSETNLQSVLLRLTGNDHLAKEILQSSFVNTRRGLEEIRPPLQHDANRRPADRLNGTCSYNDNNRLAGTPLRAIDTQTAPVVSKRPDILWTQSKWNLLLTVQVTGTTNRDVAHFSENTVSFRALADGSEFSFCFHLYELIVPDKCQVHLLNSEVRLGLKKRSKGRWPRLTKLKQKFPYLHVDFEKFQDSSSDSEASEDERPPMSLAKRNVRAYVPFSTATGDSKVVKAHPEVLWDSNSDDSDSDGSEPHFNENMHDGSDYFHI